MFMKEREKKSSSLLFIPRAALTADLVADSSPSAGNENTMRCVDMHVVMSGHEHLHCPSPLPPPSSPVRVKPGSHTQLERSNTHWLMFVHTDDISSLRLRSESNSIFQFAEFVNVNTQLGVWVCAVSFSSCRHFEPAGKCHRLQNVWLFCFVKLKLRLPDLGRIWALRLQCCFKLLQWKKKEPENKTAN